MLPPGPALLEHRSLGLLTRDHKGVFFNRQARIELTCVLSRLPSSTADYVNNNNDLGYQRIALPHRATP